MNLLEKNGLKPDWVLEFIHGLKAVTIQKVMAIQKAMTIQRIDP